ncbi:MAG: GNAT family N-acetyltransferase [Candidatus Thermoplasmatota archaeon]|jgi:RimJ/RimL family protein N-acetyltransferase|nr:GNAT family N-acetyltransferase [Candidatus Thermoplasmatota archaeon]MCL5800391.1 GNAT family N-acetyltransferase [Candidatus Thermoplasmatota archaeon]
MADSGDKAKDLTRPILFRGKKVSIGLILESDLDFVFSNINDPEVNRYLRIPGKIRSREEEIKWIRNLYSSEDIVLANVENSTGEIVGTIGLHQMDMRNKSAYVGYLTAKKYWKKGYTTEGVSLAIRYAFSVLNLRKVHSSVFAPNEGSLRVLKKNGFMEIGRYSRHAFVPGDGYVDEILLELFNPDYVSE